MAEFTGENRRRGARAAGIQFAYEQFHGNLGMDERNEAVNTAAVEVLKNRPERIGFILINHSGTDIYLSTRQENTTGSGIIIGANGGSVQFNVLEDGLVVGWQWWAIAAAGPLVLTVFESYRYAARKEG